MNASTLTIFLFALSLLVRLAVPGGLGFIDVAGGTFGRRNRGCRGAGLRLGLVSGTHVRASRHFATA